MIIFEAFDKLEGEALKSLTELISTYKNAIVSYRDLCSIEHSHLNKKTEELINLQRFTQSVMDAITVILRNNEQSKSISLEPLRVYLEMFKESGGLQTEEVKCLSQLL